MSVFHKEIKLSYNINKEHAKTWSDKKCCRCGRKNQDGKLNIEGLIHHRTQAACLDKISCKRAQRRKRRKNEKRKKQNQESYH